MGNGFAFYVWGVKNHTNICFYMTPNGITKIENRQRANTIPAFTSHAISLSPQQKQSENYACFVLTF